MAVVDRRLSDTNLDHCEEHGAAANRRAMTSRDENPLATRKILVIEDSPVVAPFTADLLGELGCEVVGPAPNMAVARELIDEGGFDAAMMDVHIRGERVFPLCEVLNSAGVPFLLTSGYADWSLPEKWQDSRRLQKPYTLDEVREALEALFSD
jgi:DNA-binding response OmpR family regulator